MPINFPTPYFELNAVLDALVVQVQASLAENFLAAVLQGSFAVGDFDEHSDVDFLVVTHDDVSDAHVSSLQAMHARLYALDSPWAQHLEGSYISRARLNRPESVNRDALWYLDNTFSSLIPSTHDNTWVVRWVTREHGIPLAGPEPKTLISPVPDAALRAEVGQVMQEWGAELLTDPTPMTNQWYWPFAVLSFCRMLQTLDTGTVQSKRAGAQWGQQHLDNRWHDLIQRAWELRPNPSQKVRTPAAQEDVDDTQEFIRYALAEQRRFDAGSES